MAFLKCGGSGNVASGMVTLSTSSTTKITLGFEPKYIGTFAPKNGSLSATTGITIIYDADVSTSYFYLAGVTTYVTRNSIGTTPNRIYSIDSDGFTMSIGSSGYTDVYYFAIG